MKLKRLLSGVTAAIMALSSIAVASFTSVSAADASDNAPYVWTGTWKRQNSVTTESTKGGVTVVDWGSNWQLRISGFDISTMKNPQIKVEFTGSDSYQVFTPEDTTLSEPIADGIKSGVSVGIADKSLTALLVSTKSGSGTIKKISIYDDPNAPLPKVTEKFSSITYNFTVIEGGNTTVSFTDGKNSANTKITGPGNYTIKRTLPTPAPSIEQLGIIEATTPVKVKVNTIVVNDKYTFNVGLEIESDSQNGNALPHIYQKPGQKEVIYTTDGAYIAGGGAITLVIGKAPETSANSGNQSGTSKPSGNTFTASLMYWDSTDNWNTLRKPEEIPEDFVPINAEVSLKGGTYTVAVDDSVAPWEGDASGAKIFCVDIAGLAKAVGANTNHGISEAQAMAKARAAGLDITSLSIITDGKVFYTYKPSDIMFGDIEGNGNLRIDIYNGYNESADEKSDNYNAPADFKDALPLMITSNKLEVKFTLTNKNANAKPATPTTKYNAAVAKKAAKQAMKKANIKKLTVKSKAKKKITVSWKKIRKANGYQVQVAKKKNFKGKQIIFKKFTSKIKLSVKSPKIKSKKTYFVRVRAYATYKNAKGKAQKVYGKFSKKVRVKVK